MDFLLDQGVPRSTAERLREAGHAATHVLDLGMERAADAEILAKARATAAIVVTFDSDFHDLLAHEAATSPSVIRIREDRLKGPQAAALVLMVIQGAAEELAAGAVVSATSRRFRCRLLPIGR